MLGWVGGCVLVRGLVVGKLNGWVGLWVVWLAGWTGGHAGSQVI